MNAKELRIGNLINVGGCTIDTYQTYMPCVVNIGMLKQIQEENKERPDAILSVWQPIPLTEEWRNMIGLGINDKFLLGVDERFYYLLLTMRNEVLVYDQNIEEFTFIGTKSYVHEIQNLIFDLSGKELNIFQRHKGFIVSNFQPDQHKKSIDYYEGDTWNE